MIYIYIIVDSLLLYTTIHAPTDTMSPSGTIQRALVGTPYAINCTAFFSGLESDLTITFMGPGGNIEATNGRVSMGSLIVDGNNMYTRTLQFTYLMEGDEGTYTCNVMKLGISASQSFVLMLEGQKNDQSLTHIYSITLITATVKGCLKSLIKI